jgi:hypothetical protein
MLNVPSLAQHAADYDLAALEPRSLSPFSATTGERVADLRIELRSRVYRRTS